MPTEPSPTPWVFPPPLEWDPDTDLVAVGADLDPGTLLAGYRQGLFPMPTDWAGSPLGWFSPVCRGVLPLDRLRVSRSLRRSVRTFELRIDTSFDEVVARCGDPARPGGWITDEFRDAYSVLHRLGWAHSVETWRDGRLVGGLYGVAVGGLFAGESMFHEERDASKAALVGLVDVLSEDRPRERILDVQWLTPHLASLGVVEVDRALYLEQLRQALSLPEPPIWRAEG